MGYKGFQNKNLYLRNSKKHTLLNISYKYNNKTVKRKRWTTNQIKYIKIKEK